MQRLFSLVDLASLLKIHKTTLDGWIKKGCPYTRKADRSRGMEWQFDIADVLRWREEQAVSNAVGDTAKMDLAEARRRKVAAEAAMVELELSKKRGQVVDIDQIGAQLEEEYANCKARLLAIPSKYAPILESTPGMSGKQALLEHAIYEALNELSAVGPGYDPVAAAGDVAGAAEDGAGQSEAASQADYQPVGGRIPAVESGIERRAGPMDHGEG